MTIKDACLLLYEELKDNELPIQSVGMSNDKIFVYLSNAKFLKSDKIPNKYEGFDVNVINMGAVKPT